MPIRGQCHCGSIRYEISGEPLRFVYCHCDDCRSINGSPFSSAVILKKDDFRISKGESELVPYESSKDKFRVFCQQCGAHIVAHMDYYPDIVIIRAGTLIQPHNLKPEAHIWVSAKAPWYDILDDLPQYAEGIS